MANRSRREIRASDDLLRRVFQNQLDRKNPRRVLPTAFKRGRPPEIDARCSVNVIQLIEFQGEPMTGAVAGQRLIQLPASVPIIDLSLEVEHEPLDRVPSHACIVDIPSEEACSRLASKAVGLTKDETTAYAIPAREVQPGQTA